MSMSDNTGVPKHTECELYFSMLDFMDPTPTTTRRCPHVESMVTSGLDIKHIDIIIQTKLARLQCCYACSGAGWFTSFPDLQGPLFERMSDIAYLGKTAQESWAEFEREWWFLRERQNEYEQPTQ